MRKWILLSVIAFLALTGILYYLLFHPWLVYPDEPTEEIDRRFALVEAWAFSKANHGPEGKELREALEIFAGVRHHMRDLIRPSRNAKLWVDPSELPETAVDALDRLTLWWRGGGGLPVDPTIDKQGCPRRLSPIALMDLGLLSLAAAPDESSHIRVETALGLAHALWRGGRFVDMMAGLHLARDAVSWLKQRNLAPSEGFTRLIPEASYLFPGLARDLVCGYYFFKATLTDGKKPKRGGLMFSTRRELTWAKKNIADRMHRASKLRDDPAALAVFLTHRPRDELPKSHLVRILESESIAIGRSVTRMSGLLEEIRQGLANAQRSAPDLSR